MVLFRFNAFIFSLVFTSIFAFTISVSSFQFEIGGEIGWSKPIGNESETYNEWAAKNRFHIGDSLYFKYKDDSVIEVFPADYLNCNTSNPISKFEDGETVFEFNRSGFFYFISGHKNHCKSGQRLIIRVMHTFESETGSPGTAPAMAPTVAAGGGDEGGDGWASDFLGAPAINSTTALSIFSYFVTALGGVIVFLYLLM